MTSRSKRREIAQETLEILERGNYQSPRGVVSLKDELDLCKQQTVVFRPDDFNSLRLDPTAAPAVTPQIQVENCTSFAGAQRLIAGGYSDPCVLNFASAKNPGGGFLGGSQAQEECLARASGLYASINPMQQYYETNRHCKTALYTDHMIYSPKVPVFRDDEDQLLEQPFQVSIVTAPAVNAGAVRDNEPGRVDQIAPTMQRRIENLLRLCASQGHRALVLGAWGCGVFRNRPEDVAGWFGEKLFECPSLRGQFDVVFFAVLSRDASVIRPFQTLAGRRYAMQP